MKKVLFIDRDGTLIIEPPINFQVDSFEKLEFFPGVFTYLSKIAKELDYVLVMVTNQDGLGTESFPEETFWPVHNKILLFLENEGVIFEDVFIDRSFEHQNLPTRKPGTAMLTKYLKGNYDLENSFVIGDRATDVLLAKNLGTKAIYIGTDVLTEELSNFCALKTRSWKEIYLFLKNLNRKATYIRETAETKIKIKINLDGIGYSKIETGIPFFNHVLEQIARHGSIDLQIEAQGDIEVDEHHTIEDVAISLGEAIKLALGKKTGIKRYGFHLPMDEADASVLIDLGGRSYFKWEVASDYDSVAGIHLSMFEHFFQSFSNSAQCNLHIKASGKNTHHLIEAIFKAFAKAVKMAIGEDKNSTEIPSTKEKI